MTVPHRRGDARQTRTVLGAEDWLRLAATPTFAVMALATASLSGGEMDILCSFGRKTALDGMTIMYVLMSVFHSAPWLALFAQRRNAA